MTQGGGCTGRPCAHRRRRGPHLNRGSSGARRRTATREQRRGGWGAGRVVVRRALRSRAPRCHRRGPPPGRSASPAGCTGRRYKEVPRGCRVALRPTVRVSPIPRADRAPPRPPGPSISTTPSAPVPGPLPTSHPSPSPVTPAFCSPVISNMPTAWVWVVGC